MKKNILSIFTIASLLFIGSAASAQQKVGSIGEFDKTVHDFGDISTSDGPVSCVFTFKNTSSKPVTIINVLSSCGCTDVKWTREPIQPGKEGTVSATYKNEDGETRFDKALTCYVSDVRQPLVLKLRGIVHENPAPIDQLYPIHFGNLGFKEVDIQCGNLLQGGQKSGQFKVANIGKGPIYLKFDDVSPFFSVKVSDNPIPAGSTATISYTITADRSLWGKNYYYATPVVNGKAYKAVGKATDEPKAPGAEVLQSDPNSRLGEGRSEFGVWAFTRENFDDWSKDRKNNGANPFFESSNASFNKVKKGKTVTVNFNCSNIGKEDLKFYSANCDSNNARVTLPSTIKPGGKDIIKVEINTTGFPEGEVMVLITLTTNAPLRPLVNLFAVGVIN